MISIITPTYNEKESIPHFIKAITSALISLKQPYEIIIVDDNSPDGTAKVVMELKAKYPQIKLLKRIGKKGIGSAYFDGYANARGEILIGIDADLSQSLKSIPLFIKELKKGNGMVIGSRYLQGSHIHNQSLFRRVGSQVFNKIINASLSLPISDVTHSYRAFKKEVFLSIAKQVVENGHPSFFIEITFLTLKNGYKIAEVPTTFTERTYGYSKLNTFTGLKNAVKTIRRLKENEK